MNLGDLEFNAEDFKDVSVHDDEDILPWSDEMKAVANRANRILKEKLEKAPLVYCGSKPELKPDWDTHALWATHKGRVVCVEKILMEEK